MVTEDRWIEKLLTFYNFHERIPYGKGEDCVHIQEITGKELVISVDSLVEKVHFSFELMDLREIGHRALALALSDLASVCATPITYLVNLEIPNYLNLDDIVEMYEGFHTLNKEFSIFPSGGNITKGLHLAITITVIGEVKKGRGVLRSGAQDGDLVILTGMVGMSKAGLELLISQSDKLPTKVRNILISKFKSPYPRIKEMLRIREICELNSAIDITDGLGIDLHRLAKMSGMKIIIEEELLPIPEELVTFSEIFEANPLIYVLSSGEELEVAFTLPPEEFEKLRKEYHKQLYVIGRVEYGFESGAFLRKKDGKEISISSFGYDHLEGR